MSELFEKCLTNVLKHEGGFVNHPADPGGMTNLGVTKKVYEEWVGYEVDKQDMMKLQKTDVSPIYKKNYWDRVKCDDLPIGVNYVIFDMSVNHGTGRASKFLQKVVGAEVDGAIGSKTLSKVEKMNNMDIIEALCLEREDFYRNLNHFDTFGNGWLNRNNEVKDKALQMIGDDYEWGSPV